MGSYVRIDGKRIPREEYLESLKEDPVDLLEEELEEKSEEDPDE